jgi:STE24 endopeptidase
MDTATLDLERQKTAKKYARIRQRLSLLDMGLTLAYLLAWLLLGWGFRLREALSAFTASPYVQVAIFAVVFGGISSILALPLSYYNEIVLPHRYGQSNQTPRDWVLDQLKSLPISAVFGLLAVEAIYAVLRAYPATWWLWAAGIMLFFSVVMSILAPVVFMPLFNKFEPLGEEHAELAQRLMALAQRARTRVRGVYQFDMSRRTKAANAALTGLGGTRRIILGDTLLNEFTADEIETVLAHELGHHVHKDIPLLIVFDTLVTLAGLWLAGQCLAWGIDVFGFQGAADPAAMPLLALVLILYGLVTMPLTNGFSRWRERLADRYALEATGNPASFISAMTRLANQNLAEVDPEPWVEFLLYSHPALGKRIRMAQEQTQIFPPAT